MGTITSLASISALALFISFLYSRRKSLSHLKLPPGPRKFPLLGNLLDLPTKREWETYALWGQQFGSPLVHLTAAGIDLIVVNTSEVANDLFNKRSAIYSSRPQFTMTSELCGWGWLMSAMPYNEAWKERRRLFTKHFHPANTVSHRPREEQFIRRMLPSLLEFPERLLDLSRHAIGGITLSLAYGLPIKPFDDPYLALADEAVEGIKMSAVPGAFLVDFVPLLKYIPEYIPGAGFQRKARMWKEKQERFHEEPYQAMLRDMAAGIAQPSFAGSCLESLEETSNRAHQVEVIKDTASMLFIGGSDTTVSVKVQNELDAVIGRERLPEFDDESSLPYLSAVIKEVIRWQPVTPIAVPHMLTEDDEYNGYYLPKGSIIIGNVWAMLHDENEYPDPLSFNPERFLKSGKINPDVRDPTTIAFGFGRRECPGRHMALSVTWMMAASILSTFDIMRGKADDGSEIVPVPEFETSLLCVPVPFKCMVKPRSKSVLDLLSSIRE